jgi:uncharacterized membrane protein
MPEGDSIFRAARTLNRALAGKRVVAFDSVLPALTRIHENGVELIDSLIWLALLTGLSAAIAALYGHYAVLPAWLTGPEICRLEEGGCAVLFRSPRSALLGIPNAALGVVLYVLIGIGLLLDWPTWWLFVMTLPAVAMSAFLGWSLITRKLQCRICWTGHIANAVLALTLGLSTLSR